MPLLIVDGIRVFVIVDGIRPKGHVPSAIAKQVSITWLEFLLDNLISEIVSQGGQAPCPIIRPTCPE
jgi:hypothetical protein